MSVTIREVTTKSELRRFVKFPIDLYKGNPYYVPGLIDEEMITLSRDKNPAFENCEAIYYLAYRGERIVGRIAGIIAHAANRVWNQHRARFGFVDFIDDQEVVDALFAAVEKWARKKGMDAIHGPMGFTDLDHEGMLIMGFDQIGTMATIYNHPYYPQHMERMGITELAASGVTEVSGGQLQRAGICRALINDPGIVFADEPTGALNSTTALQILDLLGEIHASGTTLVMVTHDTQVAARADRVLVLVDGRIMEDLSLGRYEAVKGPSRLETITEALQRRSV